MNFGKTLVPLYIHRLSDEYTTTVHSAVNRQIYRVNVYRLTIYSSVSMPMNIELLYSSVPKNVHCIPVVNVWF
jgi:hypothetical protein